MNLSWKATDTAMLYATWSEGYRPGGVQRDPRAGDYLRDILTNYELGWKTRWADDRFQFNGAIFMDEWDDIQVSFQGDNGITQVANGPSAEVKGAEVQFDWLPTDSLRLGVSLAYYDTKLKDDYCGTDSDDVDGDGEHHRMPDFAPTGHPLPMPRRERRCRSRPISRAASSGATRSRPATGSRTCRALSRTRRARRPRS